MDVLVGYCSRAISVLGGRADGSNDLAGFGWFCGFLVACAFFNWIVNKD